MKDGKKQKQTKPEDKKEFGKRIDELEKNIQDLAKTIDKVEDEKLVLQNQLKKALADYINLERDIERRTELRGIQIKLQIVKSMLTVLDDIAFAFQNSENLKLEGEVAKWVEGVKATMDEISKALLQFGVTKMEVSKGDRFDSSIHEALGTVPSGEPGTIYDIVQPGFMLNDIIVRPARVIISQPKK